ncbi:XRE family transcriptional regulator [Rhodoplanes roseus]|uniref:HTH cro/C1-type domain-containing protein n=1 Tax=Rhodoplanes roseus TaxID=29409 RepID=A0A327KZ47_9BRAD|nr:XRE family transcriptional regulator [Rhodoplanes roseus]RAI43521.1 hypothetical protein CH341_13865 [Rhodoplanes roseus]
MAFGDRLRLARRRAGLSLAALSERLESKISAQAINKYENGKMMPSSSILVELGKALGVSLDFLLQGQVAGLDGIEFRKRASTTDQERALVETEVIDHVERYLAIEKILDLPDQSRTLETIPHAILQEPAEAEKEARSLRKRWDLGGDPIPSMTALLEERNIRVLKINLPDGFSGVTCHVKRGGDRPDVPVIVINSFNVERDRFTLAHELAHSAIKEVHTGKVEKAMDRFAAAFLIPAEHLENEVGKERSSFAFQELVRLKHIYGVSMMALLSRLRDLGIISEQNYKNLFRNPRIRKWLKEEPAPLTEREGFVALEIPQRFEGYVFRALAEGLIPPTKAAALLRKPLAYVEQQFKGPQ